ncbi:MAG TPA: hypothetical protein PKL77_06205 [Candidatus Omnitrophota bacterium]|nr:hypothetical protein [Candidatus Omnitrophota bacterium]
MKKAIYNLTSKNISDLRKSDLTNTGCASVDALKIAVSAAKAEVSVKRESRRSLRESREPQTSIQFRMMISRGEHIEHKVYGMTGRPAHTADTVIYQSADLRIDFTSEADYDMYAKSYHHPGIRYTLHLGIPAHPIDLQMIDGILTQIRHIHTLDGGMTVASCTIWSHRGFNVTSKPGFVARRGENAYHAGTVKKAVAGLLRKEKLSAPRDITPGTVITKSLYHKITGACDAGIEAFQQEHDLPEKMKAADLLPILRAKNAYGISRFEEAVK